MIDAGMRMSLGEIPHLDFMTPIGILGFAPLALFLKLGSAAGQAAVLANLLVCVVLLPATWWLGASRMSPRLAWLFGGMIIVLSTAMVYGNGSMDIGFSMYYNRWSWAITFIILVALLIPTPYKNISARVDPVIIGLGLVALALIKITFFMPVFAAVVFVLISAKRAKFALRGAVAGGIVVAVLAGVLGLDFFIAYANDLLAVARHGSGRSQYPGLDVMGVLSDPSMIVTTVVLLGTIIFFRKTGRMRQGLVMLFLAPAFVYITFQNWGNDPKWLFFVILYLATFPPKDSAAGFMGAPAKQGWLVLMVIACTAAIPSATSLLWSTPRAAFASFDQATLIPLKTPLADLWMPDKRVLVTNQTINLIDETPVDAKTSAGVSINGVAVPRCKIEGGFIAQANAMSRALVARPELAGKQVLTADILNIGWLLGDLPRLTGGAVWYYGDMSGFAAADFFMVPNCALRPESRNIMIENMLQTGWQLEPHFGSSLMTLYRIIR